jgi:sulfoxide reductase heme-binding subunit YedZ
MTGASVAAPSPLWYAARGSGYVTLGLLTLSVVLGVLTAVRWEGVESPRFLVQAVHRSVSLVVLVFLTLHIVTAVLDPFAGLGLHDALIPFSSSYRSLWLGLGVIAMELLVALVVTSLLRHRLGVRSWRAVHWLAYASWPIAFAHGLGTGTDAGTGWSLLIDAGCLGAVLYAVGCRLSAGWPHRAGTRLLLGTVTAAVVGVLLLWTAGGPLRPGWARAAGTPPSLLAVQGQAPAAPSPSPSPGNAGPLPAGLDDTLQGTAPQDDGTTTRVTLTDVRDPALQVAIAVPDDAGATSATVAITRGGAPVCTVQTPPTAPFSGRCGQADISISVGSGRGGSVPGEMITTEAAS